MIIEIDDAWAESELEKQLRSLTPIDDLEEAENKLSLLKSYRREDDSFFETPDKFQSVTEDLLPASAELFFSLIQHTSNAVEQELLECQSLVDKQIEQYTIKTESEENEDDWEEEFILTNDTDLIEESSQIDDDSTRSDQKADEQKFIKSYQLRVQSDLPIYQVSQVPVSSQVNMEEINMAEAEAERERKEKELERNRKMEAERLRLEALQKVELQKIEEEMRLAEEILQKELLEHEQKIKKMNERLILEKKLHAEEMKKLEEESLRKREHSAVKIQAHFRGMRTRKLHKEELDKRIALKKKELMEEQLKYYEELIRKEQEAIEAELKQRREEEEEKRREELRAEEIRKRHMEKMRKKEEEEERLRLESEKREKAKKDEEEERSRLMSAQVLHWLQENENDQRSFETAAIVEDESDQNQNKTKDSSKDFDKNVISTVAVKDNIREQSSDIDLADPSLSKANHPIDSDINENSVQRNNLNNFQGDDNFNANQQFVLDNKVLSMVPENDNESKNSKSSFLGNIASKAKNFLLSSSSSSKIKNEEIKKDCNQSPESQKTRTTDMQSSLPSSNLKESFEKPIMDTCSKHENIKASDAPVPEKVAPSAHLRHAEQKDEESNTFEQTVSKSEIKTNTEKISSPKNNKQIHSEQSKNVLSLDEKETLVRHEAQSVKSEFQNTTTVSLEPEKEGHPAISKIVNNVQYHTNPLSYSIDMSLTPHPPLPKVAVSLDLSHKQSPITPPNKPRASPQAAKAEYRRKRKLREDLTLARQISDVSRSTSPSKYNSKQALKLNWSVFVKEFETNYKTWRDLNLPWSEHPRPPSTANSSRQTQNSLPHLEPRIVNNSCLVENYTDCALNNPSCTEVYLQNCSNCAVLINQEDVKLLSLQRCTECALNVANSHIRYLEMTECELSQVGKMPGGLTMLDLSRNAISRLAPVSCSNLVNLTLSHNSLVSTRGLQYLPNLIRLDLSYNNLSTVQNLDKCGLLQHLDLSHNQLVTVPNLKNNVLLTSLDLSANGLTTLEEFSESWLPCLQKLKLVANGLSSLPILYKICPLLLWLDVSNNMLSDTQEFKTCLLYCQLKDVACDGNELVQDIVKDYVESTCESALPDFNLLQTFLEIRETLKLNSLYDSSTVLLEKCEYLVQRQSNAKQLRQHIVTDTLCQLAVSEREASENVESRSDNSNKVEVKSHEKVNKQEKGLGEKEAKNAGNIAVDLNYHKDISPLKISENETKKDVTSSNTKTVSRAVVKKSHDASLTAQADSVLLLQSLLRGFKARLRYQNMVDEARQKVYREYKEMVKAALVIQRVWRGYGTRNLLWQWLPWLHRRQEMKTRQHKSAIKIQSVYRGYLLRRRLSEVLSQAVYDLSDCEDLDDIINIDYDETECERGWGLPPTPSLQHHIPLPPSRSSSIASTQRSVTDLSQGPVPLLPLNKLRSRDTTRANSLRSVSDISVLSLPPSRRVTPSKRHVAMAAEWGVSNQETVEKLVQRSKKFGKHVSEKRKRELIRQKILEGSKRTPLTENPPPPPTAGSAMSSDSVVYQWDDSPLHHHSSRHSKHNSPHFKRSPNDKQTLHTQVYRNPKFYDAANNVRLPPLVKKPERPNYSVFR